MIETDPHWIEFHRLANAMKDLSDRRIAALIEEQMREQANHQLTIFDYLGGNGANPPVR